VTSDAPGGPTVKIDGQIADMSIRDAAGRDVISGADGNRVLAALETLIRYSWDDDQRRETRQAQHEAERQRDRDEAAAQWIMTRRRLDAVAEQIGNLETTASVTRGRLDAVAERIGRMETAAGETRADAQQLQRWLWAILAAIALLALAMAAHYLGLIGVAAMTALIYLVRSR
jgi:hypothetical protein